jgi:hypothetical protein
MSQINIYNEPSAEVIIDENGTPVTVIIATSGAGGAVWGTITGTLSNQTDLQNALNAKVPYSGATGNVNLGEYGISAGYVQLDTTPTTYTPAVGNIGYNDTVGTLETTLKGGTVQLKIGRDIFERVVNKTGVQLTKAAYQAVRISTAQGQRLGVALAQANNDNNSADTIGLAVETIDNNQEGNIYTVGEITGINTTGSLQGETWADGDVLYLSPTVAGRITNVKPIAPQHLVVIGYVVYAHANNGKIYVKVMNGWELGELHDVDTTGATAGQVLKYNGTIWAPSADAGVTGSGTTDYVAKFTGTGTIGNSIIRVTGTDEAYVSTKSGGSDGGNLFVGTGGQSVSGSGTDGAYNTSLGTGALSSLTSGAKNVIIGYGAGAQITSGYASVAIGYQALGTNNQSGNIGIGPQSLYNATAVSGGNIAIGDSAGSLVTSGTNNILIGNGNTSSGSGFVTGSNNISIGAYNLSSLITTSSNRTLIGTSSTTSTWLGGNLLLGSTTDAGQRLQVTGNVNFGGATGLTWDNTNKRLGVGLAATGYRFEVFGTSYFDDNVLIGNGSQLRFTSSQLYIKPELVSSIWSDLSFTTLGAEKARITGTGNLLLGTTTDVGTSILTMDSTTKGFLRPRMTTVQRDAIVSPATGLSIYNTTTNRVNYYNGTAWTEIQDSITNPVTGTGVSGQVSYWSGPNTQAGSNNLFWDNANGRLGIGTNSPTVTLDTRGLSSFTGTTASDGGQLGSELLSSANWTLGAGWTGTYATGFAHSSGTATLTNTLAAVNGTYYQISYTVTNRTTGSFTIAFGGFTSGGLSGSGSVGPRATSTGTLVITPTTDFNGTIVISIKVITDSSATIQLRNSSGTITNEIRNNSLTTNTFIGLNAGSKNLGTTVTVESTRNTAVGSESLQNNTTGSFNSAFGNRSLQANTWGQYNNAFGVSALQNNLTGQYNNAFGYQALQTNTTGSTNSAFGWEALKTSNADNNSAFGRQALATTTGGRNSGFGSLALFNLTTGANNSAFGTQALFNLTTSSNVVALGDSAGFLTSTGANLLTAGNSTFIGQDSRPNADAETNQIVIGYQGRGLGSNTTVIGNSSTTFGRWWGNLLVGSSVNSGQALQVTGTSLLTGSATVTGSTTASSGVARGQNITSTLVASANNDVLVGLDINPTFTNGAFTGVQNWAIRTVSGEVLFQGASGIYTTGLNSGIWRNTTRTLGMYFATSTSDIVFRTNNTDNRLVITNGGNILVGTGTDAGFKLDVNGTARVQSDATINGLTVGRGASNLSSNTVFGASAGNAITSGANNTFIGELSGRFVTTGSGNTFLGRWTGIQSNTSSANVFIGTTSGQNNTTGSNNTYVGFATAQSNTTSNSNSFFGAYSGLANTGSSNSGFGRESATNQTTGSNNIFFGVDSGRRISGGGNLTIANNSTFLGYDTRANADSETNQLVIGYQAIGNGSNTTTIGNTSTTNNYIFGNFNVTDANNLVFGTTTGTKIGTATSQKLGFWNATPIVQPTTGIAEATFVENSGGTAVNVDSTFAGYTLQQIAQALKNLGILA